MVRKPKRVRVKDVPRAERYIGYPAEAEDGVCKDECTCGAGRLSGLELKWDEGADRPRLRARCTLCHNDWPMMTLEETPTIMLQALREKYHGAAKHEDRYQDEDKRSGSASARERIEDSKKLQQYSVGMKEKIERIIRSRASRD